MDNLCLYYVYISHKMRDRVFFSKTKFKQTNKIKHDLVFIQTQAGFYTLFNTPFATIG